MYLQKGIYNQILFQYWIVIKSYPEILLQR